MKTNLKIVTPQDHPRIIARERIEDHRNPYHEHLWTPKDGGRSASCRCGLEREAVIRKINSVSEGITDAQVSTCVYRIKKSVR